MRMIPTLLFAALTIGFSAPGALAAPEHAHAANQYLTLPQAQPTEAGARVEVIEFFSYACPHCNVLEPVLAEWVKKNASKVAFKRVHVAFRPSDQLLQRLFATLEALDLLDAHHAKVFAVIHEQNKRFNSDEDVFNWAESVGIKRDVFIATYRSFGVQARVNRAQAMVGAYRIEQWPMLAVGGRYLTSPHQAGGHASPPLPELQQQVQALQVMDMLVNKVKSEQK